MRTEEEYKNIAEELELSNECLDLANDNYAKLNARLAKVEAEREALHGIVCDCLKSLGNGSGATKECSIEFLSGAPEEIRLVVSELRADSDALAAQLQVMREADAFIFDGWAVYQEMPEKAKARTSYDNVSDVLDALAKLTKPYRNRPDNSAAILARLKAAVWMEAVEVCDSQAMYFDKALMPSTAHGAAKCLEALRAKGGAILKGLEKEHG